MTAITSLSKFPRPDFARDAWQSLNGIWRFGMGRPTFDRTIRVPFCVESEASGVGVDNPPRDLWYEREVRLSPPSAAGRILLHFGAADYQTTVWVNGIYAGEHKGGYTPFFFDITKLIRKQTTIRVLVKDSRSLTQPRGKQTYLPQPSGIFYKGVSGIWQDVWLEEAGDVYIAHHHIEPDEHTKSVVLTAILAGAKRAGVIRCTVMAPDGTQKIVQKSFRPGAKSVSLRLRYPSIFLWSPELPNLYRITYETRTASGSDTVHSYFGFRKRRAPVYQKLVLVQGYFPGGHYTPLHPNQYRTDVKHVKKLGFNGVRMHQKIEHPKFLFWCDVLGCLLWEEMPSAQLFSARMRSALEREWKEAIRRDRNHPAIIAWVPLNESWGVGLFPLPLLLTRRAKAFVKKIARVTKALDPTRLVVDNSGYDHTSETDIADVHDYLEDAGRSARYYERLKNPGNLHFSWWQVLRRVFPRKFLLPLFTWGEVYHNQQIIISEYGGAGFFSKAKKQSIEKHFVELTNSIKQYKHISGYCYSQLYDTYQEKSGLLDFRRKLKGPARAIRAVNLGADERT